MHGLLAYKLDLYIIHPYFHSSCGPGQLGARMALVVDHSTVEGSGIFNLSNFYSQGALSRSMPSAFLTDSDEWPKHTTNTYQVGRQILVGIRC